MMAALYMSVYKKAKSENLKKQSAFKISDSEPKSSSEYFYLKAKEFQHFQYILHLTRDCIPRLKKIRRSTDQTNLVLPRNVYIRIGIVGKYTEQNLSLLSKRRGNYFIEIYFRKYNQN